MDTTKWEWFDLASIFSKERGVRLTQPNREKGNTPLITAGSENEGVADYVSNYEMKRFKNVITIDMFGFSCYRGFEFCCDDNILVLSSPYINIYTGIFVATIINKDDYKCAYGRQYRQKTFEVHKIKLPATKVAESKYEPDWVWMEKYVKENLIPKLPKKAKLVWMDKFDANPISSHKFQLHTEKWKPFRYDDIFLIKKGKRLTKADMVPGSIPYIGAIDSNNGISAYISNDEYLHSANTITVSYNGSIAEAFYQTTEFWATDDVNVLYPKFELNKYIAHFLTTLIHKEKYRFNYGRKWDKELMESSVIKLPAVKTANGKYEPDWQFMEDYIKSLPYSSCL